MSSGELRAQIRSLVGDDVPLEVSAGLGPTRLELATSSDGVDLLILTSRHLHFLRQGAVSGTGDYLARHCSCPVLILPDKAVSPSAPAEQFVSVA